MICELRYDEAVQLLRPALKTQERNLGRDHPFVALALNLLGEAAVKRRNLGEAEADFQRMAGIYHAAFGDKNKHVALGLLRFGELYEARNDYARAEQAFRQSVKTFPKLSRPITSRPARPGLPGLSWAAFSCGSGAIRRRKPSFLQPIGS